MFFDADQNLDKEANFCGGFLGRPPPPPKKFSFSASSNAASTWVLGYETAILLC
jgi:hypothetical protein